MTLVVDSDILGILQRSGQLAAIQAFGALPWIITDEVWYEVTERAAANRASPATVAAMRSFLTAVAGAPTVIQPATPEARSLALLSTPPVKEDPGELSVIAYAMHHPDVTAVLHDRAAVFRGVEELHGRVLSIHGLLHQLANAHGLPRTDATKISDDYCRRYQPTRPPLWW
jgi:hypothetical protein